MKMKRSPDEKHLLATWWVLQELQLHFLADTDGESAEIKLKEPTEKDEPDKEIKHAILKQLEALNAISLLDWKNGSYSVIKGSNFSAAYDTYEQWTADIDTPSTEPVEFDDDEAKLILGRRKVQLPPFELEHLLCQVMYEYKVNEIVDSGAVIEKMGRDVDATSQRMLKDVVRRINTRVQEVLGVDALYKRQKGTIKRLR